MFHLSFILAIIGTGSAWLLMIIIALISFLVQMRFRSKSRQYAEMPLLSGLSGKDVSQRMLRDKCPKTRQGLCKMVDKNF